MKERQFIRREIAPGATATVAEDASPKTLKALAECVRLARNSRGAFPGATGSASLEIAKPYQIPTDVAVCPECGGKLEFQLTTDEPDFDGIVIDCENDPNAEHRYWQADWMPVVDAVKLHAWRMLLPSQNAQSEPRHD